MPTRIADEGDIFLIVVEMIAEAEGVVPEELTPPLGDVIDPDALDRLFAERETTGQLTFFYNRYVVTVSGDGTVSVDPLDD